MRYFTLLCLLIISPTMAASENMQPTGTRINISATAETELANDVVIIRFRVEKEGKDADKIREYINKVTTIIQKRLKNEKNLKHKTISRNMTAVWSYPRNLPRLRTSWKMTQTEQVVSTKLDAVPSWLHVIETQGAHLDSLTFRISNQTSKKALKQLRIDAIQSFKEQAQLLTQSIGGKSFRIIQLHASNQNPRPQQLERFALSDATQTTAPSLSSGEGNLRVTVTGVIEVPFRDYPAK